MKRKFLAALLALVMVFSMIPVSASAKEAKDTDKGVTFEYSDTTLSGLYGTFTVTALAPDGTQYSQITVSDFYKSGSQKNTWTINSDTYEIASISLSNGVLSSHSISENKHSVDFRCTFTQDSSTLTVQLAEHFDESQVAIEGEEIKHNGIFYYDISEVEALKMVGKSLNWQLPDSITIDGITLRYVQTNVLQPTEGFTKLDGYYENGYIDYWEADAQNGSGLATPYNIRQIEIRYNDTETAIIPYTDLKYVRVANRTSRYEIQSNDASHSIVAFYNEAESATGNDYSLYAVRFVETGNCIGESKMPPDPKYADHLYYEFTGWTIGYNGGAPFHENTTVTDDTVVYAQKKTTTSTSSEIHVMNENGELINRYIELFNASHPDSSITAESIDMGSIKITVYGQGDERTNPDYNLGLEKNGWREENSYYFVYNYLSGVGEQDNTPIAVNEITKIVIDAKDTNGNTLDPVTINRGSANGEFDATTGAGGASGYIIELYIKAAPTAPTDDDLLDDPDIDGDLAILGANAVKVTCTNSKAEHEAQTYGLIANTNGQKDSYTIGAVTALAGGGYTCTITVRNGPYVAKYGGDHTLAENEPESQNIVLTWDSDSNTWNALSTLPVNFNVICDTEPTPDPTPDPTPTPTPTPDPGDDNNPPYNPPYIPPVDPDDSGVSDLLNTDDHIQYLFGYPEGTFGPENNMTRAEVAQMFYNLLLDQDVTITKTFDDVPANAWYAKAVNTLASLGVVSGVGNGDFEPERSITRAEFTSIAMKFAEGKTGGTNIFSDVKSTDWFYRAVVNSTQYGWIHGYGDGTFRPNNPITRVEVTAIVNNMLGREADVDFVTEHYDELNHFSDLAVSHWGYYHIVEATNDHDYTKPSSGENWTELN